MPLLLQDCLSPVPALLPMQDAIQAPSPVVAYDEHQLAPGELLAALMRQDSAIYASDTDYTNQQEGKHHAAKQHRLILLGIVRQTSTLWFRCLSNHICSVLWVVVTSFPHAGCDRSKWQAAASAAPVPAVQPSSQALVPDPSHTLAPENNPIVLPGLKVAPISSLAAAG